MCLAHGQISNQFWGRCPVELILDHVSEAQRVKTCRAQKRVYNIMYSMVSVSSCTISLSRIALNSLSFKCVRLYRHGH